MAGSIATKHGDKGQTSLVGGSRVSKGDLRVEAYGTVDELNSAMGLARSLSADAGIGELTRVIQKELFLVGSALSSAPDAKKRPPAVTAEMVEVLTGHVHRIEATEGILADWSLPGAHTGAAAYDLARTICRRAERHVVRLADAGEAVDANVLSYLNRLSDLLWLFGRFLELRAGVDARLRDAEHKGPGFSRAW